MAQIDNIIEVQISRKTTSIDIRSFSIPLLLVEAGTYTGDRVTTHTSLESVEGMFDSGHAAIKMTEKLLGGDVKPSSFKIAVVEGSEDYGDALVAAIEEDGDFYAVMIGSKEDADILAVASKIQPREMLFFASSSSEDILDSGKDTDIASKLMDAGYDRTALLFSRTAETEHPEAAWVGSLIAKTVGSYSWEYKKLAGVTVSTKLTDNDIATLESKNCNYYIRVKGANITRKGKMSEGAWIDELQTSDWLKARLQEQIFFRLINTDKIPFSNTGVAMIEAEMRSVFGQAQANGAIDTYTLQSPNVYDIPEMVRVTRVLGDFKFTARLAGAVSKVLIKGVLHA